MLEGLSPVHLVLVLAIVLIVLGPGRLPEAGAAVGKAIRGFRDAAEGKEPDAAPSAGPAPSAGAATSAEAAADTGGTEPRA